MLFSKINFIYLVINRIINQTCLKNINFNRKEKKKIKKKKKKKNNHKIIKKLNLLIFKILRFIKKLKIKIPNLLI